MILQEIRQRLLILEMRLIHYENMMMNNVEPNNVFNQTVLDEIEEQIRFLKQIEWLVEILLILLE